MDWPSGPAPRSSAPVTSAGAARVLHIDAATQTVEVWLDAGEKRTVCLEDLKLAP